ncbi:MAG: NB-ARC domain-containing protein [Elainellaceae cyanobacterium]
MSSSSDFHEDKFPDAAYQWDLDRLYADLAAAKQRLLTRTERACLRGLLQGFSPTAIATELNRQPRGLQVDLTRGLYRYIETLTQVTVRNWREVTTVLGQRYRRSAQPVPSSPTVCDRILVPSIHQDWGKAPEVFAFLGRTLELAQLEQWITTDRCRLVTILGMGGMGKTSLSLKLAQKTQNQFECVIWRSLLNAPLLQDLLTDVLQTLSGQQAVTTLIDQDGAISQLLNHLKTRRCLLVLDNIETILQSDASVGYYRSGYESYGQLFHQSGTVLHQSCLLLTSREPPKEIVQLEGKTRPVRSIRLPGLSVAEGKQVLAEMDEFAATESEWQQLIKLYDGNPLVLELVGKHITNVFGGDITAFLNEGTPLFHDLQSLLDWHFDRLTPLEQEVMYWLAINREPVTVAELKEDILSSTAKQKVATTLQTLQRRFSLGRKGDCFTQQPVVMEYVTNRFIEKVCNEIVTKNIQYFNQYALIKAQTKDYIRESQRRIFVEMIVANLQTCLHNRTAMISQLEQVLYQLRQQFTELTGYGGGNLINLLCHLKVDLTGYDFSHLSIWQAYLAETKLHCVNFTGANLAKSVFAETFGGISCVAFSPDGNRIATSDTSGEVQVWHRETGQQQLTLKADTVWTWAVAFSSDGQLLATAGDDYQVKLWNAQSGECLQTLQGHSNTVNGIAFSPTTNLLASCGQDATIRLWAIDRHSATQNVTCVGILQGHQGRVWSIAFSPDGQTIVSGSEDCTLKLWDIRTGACLKTWSGHSAWVKAVAYSSDGKWVASGSFDGVVNVWQASTGNCHHTWKEHQSTVTAVAFCPVPLAGLPKNLLASSSYDQTLKFWDVETGNCLKTWQAHHNRIWFVAFSPDGQLLASGGEDHATRLWDVQTGYLCKTWKGHTNGILSLALNPNQTFLATGHEDQTVKLRHPETGEILKVLRGHTNRVWSVAFAPPTVDHAASEILASASADRTIKLWNSRTGDCLRTLEGHQSWIWSVAFDPTGDRLASGSYDQTIRLWETYTGKCLNTLIGHTAPVVSVTFSPDGQWLASSSFDTLIKLWHLPTGRCIQTLQGHEHSVWAVAFSPDGRQLASCSYDKTIKVWELSSGHCIRTFAGHTSPVICIAFSPDGQQITSGSFDRTIRLWEISSGKLLYTLCGHTEPVCSLLFKTTPSQNTSVTSNFPSFIVSSSFDETIRFWDGKIGSCLRTLRERRPYERMNIASVNGLTESQRATLCALGAIKD